MRRPTPPPSLARVTQCDYTPRRRATVVVPLIERQVVPIPKDEPVRDEGYRRLTAARPCSNCRVVGFSQAAHGPTLGAHIKASDADVFPLCCDRPEVVGCHGRFDRYELCDAAGRHVLAAKWAAENRAALEKEPA